MNPYQRMLTDLLDKRSKLGREFREYMRIETATDIFDALDKLYEKDPSSWKGVKDDSFRELKGRYLNTKEYMSDLHYQEKEVHKAH